MESFLIYILKAAGIISIFYILYIVLLKSDTTFQANRKFLLGGIFTSLILPAIYFTKKVMVQAPEIIYSASSQDSNLILLPESTALELDWWMIAGVTYLIITAFFVFKFFFRILQISKMIRFSQIQREGRFKIIESQEISGAFSFFNYLFINSTSISEEEYLIMLKHEKVHASQFHSFDMLLSHLFAAVFWFNPISWYYKKATEQNLEFIADHETARASECLQQYQHVLLKVSTNQYQNVLVNHFYQSFIKKRILMLNKKKTSSRNAWKYLLILPILAVFIMSFNVKTSTQFIESESSEITEPETRKESLSASINKTSTKESLEKLKSIFLKWDVELNFSNLEYSADGTILTAIKVKFKNLNTNEIGVLERDDSNGIAAFEIYVNKNGDTGFRDITLEQSNLKNTTLSLNEIGQNPLYIINNKEYSSQDLDGKTIVNKDKLDVLIPKDAIKRFGSKASDGAIIISEGKVIDNFESELKRIDKENDDFEMNFIEVKKGSKPVFIHLSTNKSKFSKSSKKSKKTGKANKTVSKVSVASVQFETDIPLENAKQISTVKSMGKPLIFINGEMQKRGFKLDKVNPDDIVSVNIVSGNDSSEIYGKKPKTVWF